MNEHIRRAHELLKSADETLARSAEALERLHGRNFDWEEWQRRMPTEGPDLRAWLAELPTAAAPAPRPEEPRFGPDVQRQIDQATSAMTVAQQADWQPLGDGFFEKQIAQPLTERLIHGTASSSTINEHGYSLIARGMTAILPVPILSNHTGHGFPIGEVFFIRRSDAAVYVRAVIFDNDAGDYAWSLIRSGDLGCFSGAAARDGMKIQGVVDGKAFYDEWRLREVSICRRGANPDSIFEIWDGTDDGSKFFATATVTPIRRGEAA